MRLVKEVSTRRDVSSSRHRTRSCPPRRDAPDLGYLSRIPVVPLVFIVIGVPLTAAAAGWLLAGPEPPVDQRRTSAAAARAETVPRGLFVGCDLVPNDLDDLDRAELGAAGRPVRVDGHARVGFLWSGRLRDERRTRKRTTSRFACRGPCALPVRAICRKGGKVRRLSRRPARGPPSPRLLFAHS